MELTRIKAAGELKKPDDRLLLDLFSDVIEDELSEIILAMIFYFYFE